jgi:hypothetical protein
MGPSACTCPALWFGRPSRVLKRVTRFASVSSLRCCLVVRRRSYRRSHPSYFNTPSNHILIHSWNCNSHFHFRISSLLSMNQHQEVSYHEVSVFRDLHALFDFLGGQRLGLPQRGRLALPLQLPQRGRLGSPILGRPQRGRLGLPRLGLPTIGIPRLGLPRLGIPRLRLPTVGIPRLGLPRLGWSLLCGPSRR